MVPQKVILMMAFLILDSPAAIESAPTTKPANVASMIDSREELAVATPIAKLAVESIPIISA